LSLATSPKPGVWLGAFNSRVLQPSMRTCWLHAFSFSSRWKGKMNKSNLLILVALGMVFVGAVVLCVVSTLDAQPVQAQYIPPIYKTITITNWVLPGSYMRFVNGKLYNTYYSTLWQDMPGEFGGVADNGHPIQYQVIPTEVDSNKVFCDVYGSTYWYETYTGRKQIESTEKTETIVILNPPTNIIIGLPFKFRCM
jgi:hypothetical protein